MIIITSRVALTGVFAAPVVTGADHFVVDDHVNTLIPVPTFAFAIFNHWNVHNLQNDETNDASAGQLHTQFSGAAKLFPRSLVRFSIAPSINFCTFGFPKFDQYFKIITWRVLGRSLEPGCKAPQPDAHPLTPVMSMPLGGKQSGLI